METPPEPRDRLLRIALLALAAVGVLLVVYAATRAGPRRGDPGPPVTFERLGGGELRLAELAGAPVVMEFWATWCEPCVESLPALQRIGRELGVTVLAVNRDDPGPQREERIRTFLARHGLADLQVVIDEGPASRALGITGLPTLVVLDRGGRIAAYRAGAGTESELRDLVSSALR